MWFSKTTFGHRHNHWPPVTSSIVGVVITFLVISKLPTTTNCDKFKTKSNTDTKPFSCDTKETCKWNNASSWQWIVPEYNGLQIDGPVDKTSYGGPVIMANFSQSKEFDLTSPKLQNTESMNYCFKFRYYIMVDKAESSALNLNLVEIVVDHSHQVWSTPSTEADLWYPAQVDLFPVGPFKMKFVAKAVEGYIAMSNFELKQGICQRDSLGSMCDFESGDCGWQLTDNPTNLYYFNLTKAIYTDGVIKTDHTSHSAYGHVLNLPSSGKLKSVTRLTSPDLGQLQSQCFTFWFMRVGLGVDLKVYTVKPKSQLSSLIWEDRHSNLQSEWIRVQNTIDFTKITSLYLEAINSDAKSSLKIDDISIDPFDCPEPISCEIRTDLCGWQHVLKEDTYLWSLGIGRVVDATKLKFQSPVLEESVMAYTDFTSMEPNTFNAKMSLLSEFIDPNQDKSDSCFNMLYIAKTMEQYDIFEVETVYSDEKRETIWHHSKNPTDGSWIWAKIRVPVPKDMLSYRFAITVKSDSPSTYVALRKIEFSRTKDICNKTSAHNSTTTRTPSTTTENPLKSLDCDFEKGNLCNWEVRFQTKSFVVKTPRNAKLPIVDHTTKSDDGHFAYYWALREAWQFALMQGHNPFKGMTICFQFYYFFYTAAKSTLELTKKTFDNSPLYRAAGSNEFRWREAKITISAEENDADYFFLYSDLKDGMIAIDDITVKSGECGPNDDGSLLCDFEQNSTCMFRPVYGGTKDEWDIFRAGDFNPEIRDHTTHTDDGHVYGIDLAKVEPNSNRTIYKIESKTGLYLSCFEFAYYLAKNSDQSARLYLNVIEYIGKFPRVYKSWSVTGNTEGMWFQHQQLIDIDYITFNIEMGVEITGQTNSSGKLPQIFVDDIKISKSPCKGAQYCDFEDGSTCLLESIPISEDYLQPDRVRDMVKKRNYTQLTDIYLTGWVDETWHVFTPRLSANYIQKDATLHTNLGKYLLLTANTPYNRAIFVTDRYSLGGPGHSICFSFALYKPSTQSVLEVYLGESAVNGLATKLWDTRLVTTDWTVFDILATPTSNKSIDLFLYVVGTIINPTNYIAIDNVMTKTQCHPSNEPTTTSNPITLNPSLPTTSTTPNPNNEFVCQKSSMKTIPIDKTCNWKRDCPMGEDETDCGNCKFVDHSLCRYQILNYDHSKDFRFNFSDQSSVGPSSGAWENAVFMVVGGSDKPFGVAGFQSPIVHQSYSDCFMQFFYQYNTSSTANNTDSSDTLFLYLNLIDIDQHTILWQSSFQPMSRGKWHKISIGLGRVMHPFRIKFMAYSNFGFANYHAIDQIHFEACGPLPPTDKCHETEFHCRNLACIDRSLVCDLQDDCGDGSDEADCKPDNLASFENGYNGWGDSLRKNWQIIKAQTRTDLRKGPTFDYTTKFSDGHYLLASANSESLNQAGTKSIVAEIQSPLFTSNYDMHCSFKFHYFKSSPNSILLVTLRDMKTGRNEVMFRLQYGIDGYTFKQLGYKFTARYSQKRVIFSAILNSTNDKYLDNYIALDDISFSSGCEIIPYQVPTTTNGSTTTPGPDCLTRKCPNHNGTIICLKVEQFCNFVSDCKDGSDERYCGNCDFNDRDHGDLCDWKSIHPLFPASLVLPAMNSPENLPRLDANQSSTGGYLSYQSLQSGYPIEFSYIQSPMINSKTKESCAFRFSYLTGSTNAYFQLLFVQDGVSHLKGLFNDNSPNGWKSQQFVVGEEQANFNLKLQTRTELINKNGWEMLALDNFQMVHCNPFENGNDTSNFTTVEQLTCDFEDSLCGWEVEQQSDQQSNSWFRTNNPKIEPGFDHTSIIYPRPKKFGNWISTQSNLDSDTEVNVLQSSHPIASTKQTYCLTFWYFFFGAKYSLFSVDVYKASDKNSFHSKYWVRTVPENRNWNQAWVEIRAQPDNFVLQIVARVGPLVVVGVDDIKMYKIKCPVSNKQFCDFEINNCDWNITGESWSRTTVNHAFEDHTTGTKSGYYLTDMNFGKTAQMTKQLWTLPYFHNILMPGLRKPICLTLYYYFETTRMNNMPDDNSSQLIVTAKMEGSSQLDKQRTINITEVVNFNQLSSWSLLTMDFSVSRNMARTGLVVVEGKVSHQMTHLLVDDIGFHPYRCQDAGNCDFESDMCGWENPQKIGQLPSDNILWLRVQPNSRDWGGQAMNFDHTTKTRTGNYLIFPLQMQRKSSAELKSPIIQNVWSEACFSLYYFAQADNESVIAFMVKFNDLTHPKSTRTFSIVNSTKELNWVRFERTFDNLPAAYSISLFGVYNSRLKSDVGIDDISIEQGDCQGRLNPTSTTPVPTTIADTLLDCDFERQNCNWKYDSGSWNLTDFQQQLRLQNDYYAPVIDHTRETGYGHYLLFVGDTKQLTVYKIQSTVSITFDKSYCLAFWYYEDGEDPFSISVDAVIDGQSFNYQYFESTVETTRWKPLKVDLTYVKRSNLKTNSAQIEINYKPSSGTRFSVFAIDDIRVRPGQCGHQREYIYTFSNGYDDLDFEHLRPTSDQYIGMCYACYTGTIPGAPKIDHTSDSDNGVYFLFKNNPKDYPTSYIDTLTMVNLPDDPVSVCVRFAYQYRGEVKLAVYAKPINSHSINPTDIPLWKPKLPKTSWTVAEFNKQIPYRHRLVFYLEKQLDNSSFIALDDLTVLDYQCQLPINCDFEDDRFCSYSSYSDNTTTKYNFGIFNTPAQDPLWPGPKTDHTRIGSIGSYLYMTGYRSVGTFTKLVSKIISGPREVNPNDQYCLSMWTQLTSNDVQLIVQLVRFGDIWTDDNRTVLVGNQYTLHTNWTQLAIDLNSKVLLQGTVEIQVIIEGVVEANSIGLIAIDDILLDSGACQVDAFVCEDGTKLSYDKVCNFNKDCKNGLDEVNCGNCNFETDSCGWENVRIREYRRWEDESASKISLQIKDAPKIDADGIDGHYLMMFGGEEFKTNIGSTAINFHKPDFFLKNAYKTCVLEFDYNVRSPEFSLDVRVGENLNDLNTFYSVIPEASLGTGWRQARVWIGPLFSRFIVNFMGEIKSKQGLIALDNLKFVNCSIPAPLPKDRQCPSGQVMCDRTRICIDRDSICDWMDDCSDGWDESNCLKSESIVAYSRNCNFESGLKPCAITTDQDETKGPIRHLPYGWLLRSGADILYNKFNMFAPNIDNTRRTRFGRYLVLGPTMTPLATDVNNNVKFIPILPILSYNSSFYSPMFTSVSANRQCRIRFFYFTNGNPVYIKMVKLQIFVRMENKPKPESTSLLTIMGNLEQRWTKSVAAFASMEPFQFVFTGFVDNVGSRIAIDDISYDNSSCVISSVPVSTTTTSTTLTTQNPHSTIRPTEAPDHHHNHPNHTGVIVAAVVVPILLVVAIFVGFALYRRYQRNWRTDDRLNITMSSIQKNQH